MKHNIEIHGKILSRYDEIISDAALQFVQEIHQKFDDRRLQLLNEREKRQKSIDSGDKLDLLESPDFLSSNKQSISSKTNIFLLDSLSSSSDL